MVKLMLKLERPGGVSEVMVNVRVSCKSVDQDSLKLSFESPAYWNPVDLTLSAPLSRSSQPPYPPPPRS